MLSPLVTLHGFSGAPAQWAALAPTGPLEGARHLAILGHAPERRARGGETWATEIEHLAAALPERPVHLAGYSLGARLALGVAAAHPERIAALTLISVNPGLASDSERRARRLADARWVALLEEDGIDAFAAAWEAQPLWDSQRNLAPELLERQRQQRRSHDPHQLAASLRSLGLAEMPSYWDALASLRVPLRLLAGALDTKFVALARRAAELAPRASYLELPGCGHNPLLEAPALVAELLTS